VPSLWNISRILPGRTVLDGHLAYACAALPLPPACITVRISSLSRMPNNEALPSQAVGSWNGSSLGQWFGTMAMPSHSLCLLSAPVTDGHSLYTVAACLILAITDYDPSVTRDFHAVVCSYAAKYSKTAPYGSCSATHAACGTSTACSRPASPSLLSGRDLCDLCFDMCLLLPALYINAL